MAGSVDELRFSPTPRASSCVGGVTNVQHALTVRGARQVLGLAEADSVHDLQKSALPSAGAPSHVAPPPPAPASARGAELLELHATPTSRSAAQKEEKVAEDDCFMAAVIVEGAARLHRARELQCRFRETCVILST
jgi:hypothetical protein